MEEIAFLTDELKKISDYLKEALFR